MPRTALRSAAIALSVGATCIVHWTGAAPSLPPAVLVGYGSSLQTAPGAADAPGAGGPRTTTPTFSITGKVAGLFPGKTIPLVLTLTNPNKLAITVSTVNTTVANATASCTAIYLAVSAFSGHLAVAAGKSGKVTVDVTMKTDAPNSCEGKTFPLHYTGSATEA